MSTTEPVVLPITGSVDPALLAGLVTLATNLGAAGAASEAAGERAKRGESAWSSAADTLRRGAQTFNEVTSAVGHVLGVLGSATQEVTALATEQARLEATSRRLGLNFDDMAAGAGRFTDETQAMGVATTLAAQGLNLTQQQSESLMRVIGAASVRQNLSMQEAIDQTTTAIVRGREVGLRPFGAEVERLSGHAHTANERLVAIVATAGRVELATDTAADQVERLRDAFDDSKRAVATSFVRELGTLQSLTTHTGTTREKVDDLGTTFNRVGETIATTVARAVIGIRMLGAIADIVIGGITGPLAAIARAGTIEGVGIDAARQRWAAITAGFREESDTGRSTRAAALLASLTEQGEAITARIEQREREGYRSPAAAAGAAPPPTRPPRGGGSGAAAAPAAALSAEQMMARADMGFTEAQRDADAARAGREQIDAVAGISPEDRANRAAEASRAEIDAVLATERARLDADETRAVAADAEVERLASERDRLAAQVDAHASYTGRLRELYGEQASASEMAATSTASAFNEMGKALGAHVTAVVQGKETIGEALQGMLSDTLLAVGREAVIKGAMEIAHGVAAIAGIYTAGLAPGHFAAGAAYLAVGAAAGIVGAAIAPSAGASGAGAGAGASSGGGAGAGGQLRDQPAVFSDVGGTVVNNFYSPVIGGRAVSDAELGTRMGRYDDAARARTRRAA